MFLLRSKSKMAHAAVTSFEAVSIRMPTIALGQMERELNLRFCKGVCQVSGLDASRSLLGCYLDVHSKWWITTSDASERRLGEKARIPVGCVIGSSMAQDCPPPDYELKTCTPSDLSQSELAKCIALVETGGAVDPTSVKNLLPRSTVLVVVRKDNQIVGVGAIKDIRKDYALKKAKESGVIFPPETRELGYVRVHDDHQKKGLSSCIVKALLSTQDGPLFATTSSLPMKKTLRDTEFVSRGCEWAGQGGSQLSLWLRAEVLPVIEPLASRTTSDQT